MDIAIPLATFEVTKVRIGPLNRGAKVLLPMTYQDGDVKFHHVLLAMPGLTVKSYDAGTGRLLLSLPAAAATKFQAFQDSVLASVAAQQQTWFPGEPHRSKEELRAGFQPILDHGALSLYCPSEGVRGLVTGAHVRIACKIQGVSFHKHPVTGVWTGKFRLQHRIQSILVIEK